MDGIFKSKNIKLFGVIALISVSIFGSVFLLYKTNDKITNPKELGIYWAEQYSRSELAERDRKNEEEIKEIVSKLDPVEYKKWQDFINAHSGTALSIITAEQNSKNIEQSTSTGWAKWLKKCKKLTNSWEVDC